jgi:predicted dehydrogenase
MATESADTYETTSLTAAVIGCGAARPGSGKAGGFAIGHTHAIMYGSNPRTRLIASADVNEENLRAFNEKFNVPHGYSDYREMLERHRPDIVSIATYVGLHRQMIEDAARAGAKAIFCEKPFVCSPVELRAVRDVVRETGVKLSIAFVRRYRPAFIRARELYSSGAIGQSVLCAAGIQDWDLSEWGSHWFDMFRFFHRDALVKWVLCQARVRGGRMYGHAMEDHAAAYFEFEGGGKGLVDGGVGINGAVMSLIGSEGTIRIYDEARLVIDDARGRHVEDYSLPDGNPWHALWNDNLSAILKWMDGGEEPQIGFTHTAPSVELNLAAYTSAVRGDQVDFPLDDAFWSIGEFPVEELARRAAARQRE